MRMSPKRHRLLDGGFTLIEMVISITILGIIAVSLTGVVIEYLKVTNSTETRLSESTDTQIVSAYWQNDVSSLGARTFSAGAADQVPSATSIWVGTSTLTSDPGGCGAGDGALVVSFAWNGYPVGATDSNAAWVSAPQRVAYLLDGSRIKRVWCGSTGEPVLVIARNLAASATYPNGWRVTCDGGACGASVPRVVQLTLHVQDTSGPGNSGSANTGYDVTLTGERRQGS